MADPPALDLLLDYLKRTRGFDFRAYKRSTLERRIAKRMAAVGVPDYSAYLDVLEVQPDEFAALFDTILINVTSFFRDPPAWDHLAQEVLPRLLEESGDDAPLRFWCAGCASGEEPYTLAVILSEALGDRSFRERVKIYATDVDEDALEQARAASYTAKQVEALPSSALERCFERTTGDRFTVRGDLRRSVIFGRNDLIQDAPISRVDLLVCRNTLMYFNADAQGAILQRLNFALNPHGALFLGKAEMLITHPDLFTPVSIKHRIFAPVVRTAARPRHGGRPSAQTDTRSTALLTQAFELSGTPQAVVDAEGRLGFANRQARELFSLGPNDLGRPLRDLELSYRPTDLRSALDGVAQRRETIALDAVSHRGADGQDRMLAIQLAPLTWNGEALLGSAITFHDVTEQHRLTADLESSRGELENAYEELQSSIEELETTNEELQSTNEELETTNEELQAANEELETTNEELQSTNEELETINDELRQRSQDLDEANAFLGNVLASRGLAAALLNAAGLVQVWNEQAVELWGLRPEEVEGHALVGLDIGLPVARLDGALREILDGGPNERDQVLEAVNRRGRPMRCRVTLLAVNGANGAVSGAMVLMEQLPD